MGALADKLTSVPGLAHVLLEKTNLIFVPWFVISDDSGASNSCKADQRILIGQVNCSAETRDFLGGRRAVEMGVAHNTAAKQRRCLTSASDSYFINFARKKRCRKDAAAPENSRLVIREPYGLCCVHYEICRFLFLPP